MNIGLSMRLFGFTLVFVLFGGFLLYIPALVDFRKSWLGDRLAQARTAALMLQHAAPDSIQKPIITQILADMDTSTIALRQDQARQLIAMSDMPPMVDFEIDLRIRHWGEEIRSSFDTLLFGGNRAIRVVGRAPMGAEFVEIVILERAMRAAMVTFSGNALFLVLFLSTLTAGLIYVVLNALVIRPVRVLVERMMRFAEMPQNATNLFIANSRVDEIGTLERTLTQMQLSLQHHLRQRERLANLGLAVAKINHDLRNMLASAQLMADRLSALPNPEVQRFLPKLVSALDRAITFCQSTLAYGKVEEQRISLRPVALRPLVEEAAELVGFTQTTASLNFKLLVAKDIVVLAENEHLLRVFINLFRNAYAALPSMGGELSVESAQQGDICVIFVCDNGSGIPLPQRGTLFEAFAHSSKAGSTGLGLAITQELMHAMGGTITLESAESGTCFRLTLPIGVKTT